MRQLIMVFDNFDRNHVHVNYWNGIYSDRIKISKSSKKFSDNLIIYAIDLFIDRPKIHPKNHSQILIRKEFW